MMGKLNDSQWALPLLVPNLNDASALVRKNAALSLMKLEDPAAIEALEKVQATESDEEVKPILTLVITQLKRHADVD